jgi:hypothetical protein
MMNPYAAGVLSLSLVFSSLAFAEKERPDARSGTREVKKTPGVSADQARVQEKKREECNEKARTVKESNRPKFVRDCVNDPGR